MLKKYLFQNTLLVSLITTHFFSNAYANSDIIQQLLYKHLLKVKTRFLGSFVILIAFLMVSFSVNAQIHEKLQGDGYTFEQIVNQSELYFDQVGRQRGVGYKQYQRWKYWASRNLDTNGKVRSNIDALKSYQQFSQNGQDPNMSMIGNGSYTELGPLTSVYTSTWSSGLGRVSSIGLDLNDDNHIIVGSPSGGIWKTTNLGNNWSPLFDDQAMMDVYALEISHSNSNHYFAGLVGGIMRSTDGGVSWTNVSGLDSNDKYNTITMHPTDPNIIFAIGQNRGKVYKSTNGGSSFSLLLDETVDLYDLEFQPGNPNTIYVSGDNIVLKSTNGGSTFSELNGPWNGSSNTIMLAVTSAAPNNLYVLQEQGGGFDALYLSQNSGSTWTTLDSFDGTNNIMGYDQNVQNGQAPRDMDIIVSTVNPNIIHVAGVETWRSTNLGQSWSQTTYWNHPGDSDFIHADIDILIYDGNRIVAGTDGGIHFSTNEASSWTDISEGLGIRQFYRIGASQTQTDRVSGGSQDNGTGTLVDGTWRDWLGADGMETFIDWNNANIIYGTSQYGTLYKSIDGGISRTSISNSPPSGNWVTPFEQDPITSTTIYVATNQVYKSTNSGGSWSSISSFSNGNADELKISPGDPNYIYVSYGTTLYRTTNGGGSWSSNTIPSGSRVNYITLHPTDPNRLAIAVSGSSSKIYESVNGGSSWTNITGNIPSVVSIECVLYDTLNGGFYAGGNPGVYYSSSSSSANYSDVSSNLPKVRVTELEIRNEVIYVGTYGRGLWKYNTNTNTAPIFAFNPLVKANGTKDEAYTEDISGDATDADGDSITFSKVSGPTWLSVASNGGLSGTPLNSDIGLNSFVVRADDGNGGTGDTTLEITVDAIPDTIPPVITLIGASVIDLEQGESYNEQSATAIDNIDGDISANIIIGGDVVDTNTIGTYLVTYNVSDAAGNTAVEVTRTVNVTSCTDSDGDGVCDNIDQCPGYDDNIDINGNGIPDGCDSDCLEFTTSFNTNPLTHTGSGSGSTTLVFPTDSQEVSFTISNIGQKLNGKPSRKYIEHVVVTFMDRFDNNITYGTYSGASVSSVFIDIQEFVKSVTIALSDEMDGNTDGNMSISFSTVDYCVNNIQCDNDADGDGVCDGDDQCLGFDDMLIGTPCEDGDVCTTGETYGGENDPLDPCGCGGGFYTDADGDGFCIGDDPDDNDGCVPDPQSPTCNPCGDITNDSFESGFGNWNDGGNDCARVTSNSNTGSYNIRLRDNSGNASSIYSDNLDLNLATGVIFDFSFYATSMEIGEDFLLEYSIDGGSNYNTIQTWVSGDFNNNTRYNESVDLSGFSFSANTVFRIRCDASHNNDQIYIDDVVINGCMPSQALTIMDNNIVEATSPEDGTTQSYTIDTYSEFVANSIIIYPNPASTNLFVDYGILEDINANFLLFDMSGRLIRNVVMNKQNSQMRIDLDGISNGLYLIKILDQNGQIIKTDRVIVQK